MTGRVRRYVLGGTTVLIASVMPASVCCRAAPLSAAASAATGPAATAQPDDRSQGPSVSANGRYVVFSSRATNLVPGDPNHASHVYIRDLRKQTTTMVDVSESGSVANADGVGASVSGGGRFVAFTSDATNLVPGVADGQLNVYVRDMVRHTTRLVSVPRTGLEGNGPSFRAYISESGRYITFTSGASDLAPGTASGVWNVFIRDLTRDTTALVSAGTDDTAANAPSMGSAVSADGRLVAFTSLASNLVAGTTRGVPEVYVRDMRRGITEIVSTAPDGAFANGNNQGWSLSSDGRFVVFSSTASNLVPGTSTGGFSHIYVRDLASNAVVLADVANNGSPADASAFALTAVSATGRYVVFSSDASDIVPGVSGWNVYLRDLTSHETELISAAQAGGGGNGQSAVDAVGSAVSSDGCVIGFTSAASDLTADAHGDFEAAFVSDHCAHTTETVSRAQSPGTPGALSGPPGQLNNNELLRLRAEESVTLPDGDRGTIEVVATSFVEVPFFSRSSAEYTLNNSYARWLGPAQAYSDSLTQTDEWRIDSYGGAVSISNTPPGATISSPGDLQWQTTVTHSSTSEHSWNDVQFGISGVLYRIRYNVSATFQFGSSSFVVSAGDSALD